MNNQLMQLIWQGYTTNSDSVGVYKAKAGYRVIVRDMSNRVALSVEYKSYIRAEARAIKLTKAMQ